MDVLTSAIDVLGRILRLVDVVDVLDDSESFG